MQELKLKELLRYGFAGTIFLLALKIAYNKDFFAKSNGLNKAELSAVALVVMLAVGSIIYALHRAVLYPGLYALIAYFIGRGYRIGNLDIIRWQHLCKPDALQHRMGEWADQVHFLYCIGWASLTAIVLGSSIPGSKTGYTPAVFWTGIAFVLAGVIHHIRYQLYEKEIFNKDKKASADHRRVGYRQYRRARILCRSDQKSPK